MKKLIIAFLKNFASLKVSCGLLAAFLLLLFWGVLGQTASENADLATERFFNSYFLWAMGVVPLPALKSLAVISAAHLICSLKFRMPRIRGAFRFQNLGLWGMHIALILLLLGGVAESEFKQEYNGFRAASEPAKEIAFYEITDSLNAETIEIPDKYPYFIFYKGQVDMFGIAVDVYTATYDPLKFVPYLFSILFLLSAGFHYGMKMRWGRKAKALPIFSMVAVLFVATPFAEARESSDSALFGSGSKIWQPNDLILVNDSPKLFDSFSRGVLDDFSGRVTYKCETGEAKNCPRKMNAAEVVSNIFFQPQAAQNFKLFKVLRSDVLHALNLPENERYVSYKQLNSARTTLELYASRKDDHPATAEMKRILSNVNLYEAIERGEFAKVNSESKNSEWNFKAELFYNRANFALIAFALALLGCVLASVNSIFKSRALDACANFACGFTAAILAVAFALRFYIASRPPLSSLYEIVLLVALLLESFEMGAFLFCKRRTFSLMIPVTAMAVLLLFFAKFILEPGDLFQSIPAALNSSVFLTLHVFTIALGFAFVILSGIVAHVVLWRLRHFDFKDLHCDLNLQNSSIKSTFSLMRGTLIFGSVFTIVGTLLGGVWADFAWGRFWGFDPKECGALFVILWTMLALHLRAARILNDLNFALFNSFNVIVVFLCWFGINLLGVGLHSYGFQNGTFLWLAIFVVIDILCIVVIRRNCRKSSVNNSSEIVENS